MTVYDALDNTTSWLEQNPAATKAEIESKRKEVHTLCNPIVLKYHESSNCQNHTDCSNGLSHGSGPQMEPVD